jgi:adenylyltransferase and sulfurtransferase
MYDSLGCSFHRIKKPAKQPKCPVCGPEAVIRSMEDSDDQSLTRGPSCSIGSNQSTANSSTQELPPRLVVTCEVYNELRERGQPHILLDVRVEEQFTLCSLDGAVNIPLDSLSENLNRVEQLSNGIYPIYCICRRGLASVTATKILSDAIPTHPRIHSVANVRGGLDLWRRRVDSSFPKY